MQKRFGRALQTAIVTETRGSFEQRTDLTAAEEIASDSAYFIGEHRLTSKIAIEETVPEDSTKPGRKPTRKPSGNFERYSIVGVPTFAIIDRDGTLRWIQAGTGDLEATLTREIGKLTRNEGSKRK